MAYDSQTKRPKILGSVAALAAFLAFAGRANAQSYSSDAQGLVDLANMDGVASVMQQSDGSVLVTMDNGETITLAAGEVVVENGVIYADPAVFADVGAAAGLELNPYLIGAGVAGALVIGAASGAYDDDDDDGGAVNAAPVFVSGEAVSVDENNVVTGYTAQANDADGDNVTFAISGGADASLFTIDANTGELSFIDAPDFETPADADGNNTFIVEISASDGQATATQTVTVTVNNLNDNAPVFISGDAVSVVENGTDAYQAQAEDADGDAITFSLSGADAALFTIDAATGLVTFIQAPDFDSPSDANGDNAYQITVSASDGENTTSIDVTISVTDQVELVGSDQADILTGSDQADIIDANGGDDFIDSLAGSDQISTGTGRDILNFSGDPFEGADVSAEGRQIVGGEDFISDFDFANDAYQFDAEDYGVSGDVVFASLDANADGAAIPAGANVIVLLNSDNDGDASTPFLAGTAAAQIAALVDDAGPGFFVYFNSNLGVNRLVYSTDLSDATADLRIVSRQTDLDGQDAINALADFSAENFVFNSNVETGDAEANSIIGSAEADFIDAGAGDDTIDGGAGADTIRAGDGNDTIVLSSFDDGESIDGGEGIDTLDASALDLDPDATVVFDLNQAATLEIEGAADANTSAVSFDEAIGGDLSDDNLNPSELALGEGDNIVTSGQQGDPRDIDYFTITVPEGQILTEIVLQDYEAGAGNLAFIGIQRGEQFTVDAASAAASDLLGGLTYGAAEEGGDILAQMGQLPGSEGFTPPLEAGTYTIWLNQTSAPSTATLNFVLEASGPAASIQTVELEGIENIVGTEGAETIIGTDDANRIESGGGSDTIISGDGEDVLVFAGDPFDGADVSAAGRQIVGGEDFIEDFSFTDDTISLNAADFGVEQNGIEGDVEFLSLDANAADAVIPAGTNVIVLLNSDNDGDASTPFLAGTAATQIAGLTEAD
ncbi:MAG: cadherin domain-containing protein, partial [Pseudomonadota bacterium]